MRASWILIVVIAAGAGACLRSTVYRCSTNTECGTGGSCESVGFCSFPDTGCATGERFGDSAGPLANQCTGTSGLDGGLTDSPPIDGVMIDSSTTGCPGDYVTITGGQGTHRYRILPTGNWMQQRDMCVATTTSAYLAIPDGLGELQALAAFAGATPFWVGITDSVNEGTWVTVKGTPQTFLPWDSGSPSNGNNSDDCVEGVSATQLNDERCNTQNVAVCECEP